MLNSTLPTSMALPRAVRRATSLQTGIWERTGLSIKTKHTSHVVGFLLQILIFIFVNKLP